jgi:hypothetical protein
VVAQSTDTSIESSAAATRPRNLRLGPHTFVPNPDVRSALIRTHFQNTLGAGQALGLETPLIVIDSQTVIGLRGSLVFAALEFEYQYAMKDWLAVWVRPQMLARLGTNVQTLLAQGVSAGLGFELGTLFELYQSERFALSGTMNLVNSNATLINLLDFVEGVVDSGYVVVPLVQSTPILSGGAGVRAAWAASDLFGFLGAASLGLAEDPDPRQSARVSYDLGGAVDIDLSARTAVPLGASLAYNQSTKPEGWGGVAKVSRAVRLTLGYTSRDDYFIGLDIAHRWLPSLVTDQTIHSVSILVTTRYFF